MANSKIKRVNFTGRKRFPKSNVDIEIKEEKPRIFNAIIDLEDQKLPPDSRIFLEAMCAGSSVIKRFDFGTVNNRIVPENRSLEEIEGDNVFFALKIVDHQEQPGRILRFSDKIYPKNAGDKTEAYQKCLLPIEEQPLGEELWKLDFGTQEVTLIVNSEIPGLKERTRFEPLFYALIFPPMVSIILTEALDQGATPDDEDDHWPSLWLQFGVHFHPEKEDPPNKADEDENWREWVEEVVTEFSKKYSLKTEFLKSLGSVDGGQ